MKITVNATKEHWEEADRMLHAGIVRSQCCPVTLAMTEALGARPRQVETGFSEAYLFPSTGQRKVFFVKLPANARALRANFDLPDGKMREQVEKEAIFEVEVDDAVLRRMKGH